MLHSQQVQTKKNTKDRDTETDGERERERETERETNVTQLCYTTVSQIIAHSNKPYNVQQTTVLHINRSQRATNAPRTKDINPD